MKNPIIQQTELINIAKEAGKIALKIRKKGLSKSIKSGRDDVVTHADIAVSEFIRRKLSLIYPGISFIDEEYDQSTKQISDKNIIAIVDPIDGTTNFINKNVNWAVSIGIVIKSHIAAGIIYQPEKENVYFAEKGKGAFLNDEGIQTSSMKTLNNSIGSFDYPYKKDKNEYEKTERIITALTQKIKLKKLYNLRSLVLEIMEVATGKTDFLFHLKVKPWDVAAAIAIVREAGGKCYNTAGHQYKLFEDNILITNGAINHQYFTQIVNNID